MTGPSVSSVQQRHATSDYGSKQSGFEQGMNETNPKAHHEHPGPKSPANQSGSSAQSDGSKAAASESTGKPQPKISNPNPPSQSKDADVKKHNEEMENRAEKTSNRIGEDGKVDKSFWKGRSD